MLMNEVIQMLTFLPTVNSKIKHATYNMNRNQWAHIHCHSIAVDYLQLAGLNTTMFATQEKYCFLQHNNK